MEFTNEFVVPAAPDAAWALLTDVPKIAPCLPGATVTPVGDGQYEGGVTVKVGPIKVGYSGSASFTELDATNHRMVLTARGKESSGKGSASATVTVDLVGEGPDKTRVVVGTDLQITGKVAQFGRSAMADVGARLIGQFASNLEAMVTGSGEGTQSPTLRPVDAGPAPQSESELNALALAWPVAKRGVPVVAAFLLGALISRLTSRR
ncbi:SRPBCC family protein [Streptomyces sp. NPDC086766]|uniref:SRPBCC family protein n=1 Tax=Streptomyces sp. NPDC086766 TaxID=3365754 RepID=UPI00380A216A